MICGAVNIDEHMVWISIGLPQPTGYIYDLYRKRVDAQHALGSLICLVLPAKGILLQLKLCLCKAETKGQRPTGSAYTQRSVYQQSKILSAQTKSVRHFQSNARQKHDSAGFMDQ